jgi:hypothetical protein
MKLKLKGRRSDTTEEIQAESHRGLGTLTDKGFPKVLQKWRGCGTGVYMWEGTASRVMAADRPCCEFFLFLKRQSGIFWILSRTFSTSGILFDNSKLKFTNCPPVFL